MIEFGMRNSEFGMAGKYAVKVYTQSAKEICRERRPRRSVSAQNIKTETIKEAITSVTASFLICY